MSMIFRASEYGGKATGSYSAALKVFTLLSKVATNSTILDLIYSNPAALVGARSVVSARSGGVLIGGQTYPLPTVAGLSLVSGSGSTGPPQEPPKKKRCARPSIARHLISLLEKKRQFESSICLRPNHHFSRLSLSSPRAALQL